MTALPGQRMHYCGKCVSGEHDLDIDSWKTEFCRLQREHCQCDCDCPYYRVLIEEPRCHRRRTPRRWHTTSRHSRAWTRRHLHETIGYPILSPEEYIEGKTAP
ncbi:hypothetical protein [Actinosynnema sp. ALI-1.44]|uniref:hypothetical protein n=1 Tax=Actinosynnema sp. ALI-1.44 TaxID=1933779 RepID=UPI0011780E61|nr:hypothetical protein [Actinosynnema sp. ALI-1.44]